MQIRLSRKRNEKQIDEPGSYSVRDANCIGCSCFVPGLYQHRGATMSGSRATGMSTKACLTREYRGCPSSTDFTRERAAQKRKEGWK